MAEAWDPLTGRPVAASDIANLLAAVDASSGITAREHQISDHAVVPPGPDVLHIQLIDANNTPIGSFVSRDKHESASRVCSFLSAISPNGRVTITCGTWSAIALRHPNGRAVQTSYMNKTSTVEPGVLLYSFESMPEWALGICSMLLFTYQNDQQLKYLMSIGEQRRKDVALQQHLAGMPPGQPWPNAPDNLVQPTPPTMWPEGHPHAPHANATYV